MDSEELQKVWKEVEERKKCEECPLVNKSKPLLFNPGRLVNVVVITEGPNRMESLEFIASLANHPTFTTYPYLYRIK